MNPVLSDLFHKYVFSTSKTNKLQYTDKAIFSDSILNQILDLFILIYAFSFHFILFLISETLSQLSIPWQLFVTELCQLFST